jgi:hypothetical protein
MFILLHLFGFFFSKSKASNEAENCSQIKPFFSYTGMLKVAG